MLLGVRAIRPRTIRSWMRAHFLRVHHIFVSRRIGGKPSGKILDHRIVGPGNAIGLTVTLSYRARRRLIPVRNLEAPAWRVTPAGKTCCATHPDTRRNLARSLAKGLSRTLLVWSTSRTYKSWTWREPSHARNKMRSSTTPNEIDARHPEKWSPGTVPAASIPCVPTVQSMHLDAPFRHRIVPILRGPWALLPRTDYGPLIQALQGTNTNRDQLVDSAFFLLRSSLESAVHETPGEDSSAPEREHRRSARTGFTKCPLVHLCKFSAGGSGYHR
jgi:hypothetical protein